MDGWMGDARSIEEDSICLLGNVAGEVDGHILYGD